MKEDYLKGFHLEIKDQEVLDEIEKTYIKTVLQTVNQFTAPEMVQIIDDKVFYKNTYQGEIIKYIKKEKGLDWKMIFEFKPLK